MISFWDASALAKLYVVEPAPVRLHRLARTVPIAASRLTQVEVASAVARRFREGVMDATTCKHTLDLLDTNFSQLRAVDLSPEVVDTAMRLMLRHPLRAGDAVQLASAMFLKQASIGPVEFICFDDRLLAAARAEGLPAPTW